MPSRTFPPYHSILDDAPVGIYRIDPDGSLRYANRTLVTFLGFTSFAELQKSPLQEHLRSLQAPEEQGKELLDLSGVESTWLNKVGTPVRVRESRVVIRDVDGTVHSIEGTVEEIAADHSRRHTAGTVDDRYQRVVDNLREVVFQIDTAGAWVFLNPAWKNVTGFDVEESIGKQFVDYIHAGDRTRVFEEFQRLVRGEADTQRLELRYTTKDAEARWVEVYTRLMRTDTGEILGVTGTLNDITNRKVAEDALRDSEERYRKVIEISPNGIIIHDKGRILYANPASLGIMRAKTVEQLYAVPIIDFIHPDSREIVGKRFAAMTDEGANVPVIEERFIRMDGTTIDVEVAASPLVYGGKKVFLVVVRDITDRKTAERALRESEERYRTVVTSLHEGVILQDAAGTVLDCNRSAESILNLRRNEIVGRNGFAGNRVLLDHSGTAVPPEDAPPTKCLRSGKPILGVVMGFVGVAGTTTWIRVNSQPLLERHAAVPYAVATSFTDITKEREALKTLESQAELFELVSDAVVSTDNAFHIASWNRSAELRYGWTREEAIGKVVYDLLKAEFPTMSHEEMSRHLQENGAVDLEVVHVTKTGRRIDVSALITLTRNRKGDVTGSVGILRDISERKRAQALIHQREAMLEMMFQKNATVMLLVDPVSGEIADANPTAAAFYGYPLEQLKTMNVFAFNVRPEGVVRELLTQAQREERDTFFVRHKIADGSVRDVEIHASPIVSHGRTMLFAILHDVTDRLEAERQLQTSLKEKEVLLKEVYHRVKNNLNVVAGLLSLQSRFVKAKEDVALFEETKSRIQAMGKVHQNLYQSEHLSSIDFGIYLKDLIQSVGSSYGPPGVITEVEVDTIAVGLDQAVPCGLIVNELLTNSYKYAFQGRGSGKVKVSCHVVDPSTMSLTVQDDGVGLPEEVDFTGLTSLGLSLVAMLADQIDAKLSIVRKHGTTFNVLIPIQPA